MSISRFAFIIALLTYGLPLVAQGPSPSSLAGNKPSYQDKNRDGINDLFRDANGDGINDVNGQPYLHRFLFIDKNGDGINDKFVDGDGDGVNDLEARFLDRDKDGHCDNIVDYDGDGTNDITGDKYSHQSLNGFRFGRVEEELNQVHSHFVDDNGDGMHDLVNLPYYRSRLNRPMDYFIDEDGDGIRDGRPFHQSWRGPLDKNMDERKKRLRMEKEKRRHRHKERQRKGRKSGPRP